MTAFSQSMVSDLLQCPQKFAFAYGQVAGFPLAPKVPALRLREGRAWGAAVQAYHAHALEDHPRAVVEATRAITLSLEADAAQLREAGAYDHDEHEEVMQHLFDLLAHYCATAPPLRLIAQEKELRLDMSGYTYACHIDGIHEDEFGALWIFEAKLRSPGRMTPLDQAQLWRQVRWYALAYEIMHAGTPVAGVIIDERLNEAPKPVKLNKDRSVSATQSCLYEEYVAACSGDPRFGAHPTPPNQKTLDRLQRKVWQQRHEIIFTRGEMDDARAELESAAMLVDLYRTGTLTPIRNPGSLCATCAFFPLCPTPQDTRLRDALYIPNDYEAQVIA